MWWMSRTVWTAERWAEVEHLRALGESWFAIADAFGVQLASIEKAAQRRGRNDLARDVNRARNWTG